MAGVRSGQVLAALAAFEAIIPLPRVSLSERLRAMQTALETAEAAGDGIRDRERQARADENAASIFRVAITGDISRIALRQRAGIVRRCHAQQCGDEMLCGRCGLTWAADDPEPPACAPVERRLTTRRGGDR